MKKNDGFKNIGDLINLKQKTKNKKPPAYEWQDLALKVIDELKIPGFKRNSVFRVCKLNSKIFIEQCMNDTKELCNSGEKWKYFFKIVGKK